MHILILCFIFAEEIKIVVMFVRFEKVQRKEGLSSVIDENNKYLGDVDELNLLECLDLDKNFEEVGYTFFFADKKELEKRLCLK